MGHTLEENEKEIQTDTKNLESAFLSGLTTLRVIENISTHSLKIYQKREKYLIDTVGGKVRLSKL